MPQDMSGEGKSLSKPKDKPTKDRERANHKQLWEEEEEHSLCDPKSEADKTDAIGVETNRALSSLT